MKKALGCLMLVTVMLFAGCAWLRKATTLSSQDVLRMTAASTVTIDTDEGQGSGTVVAVTPSGSIILTCAHVLAKQSAPGLKVIYRGEGLERVEAASVMAYDEDADLALVFLPLTRLIPITIAREEPEDWSKLYVVASPGGVRRIGAELILSRKDSEISARAGKRLWQIQGLTIPGMSGGTITNNRAELVCVPEIAAGRVYRVFGGPGIVPIPYGTIGWCIGLHDIRVFLGKNGL